MLPWEGASRVYPNALFPPFTTIESGATRTFVIASVLAPLNR
jgi:hypothetical protein